MNQDLASNSLHTPVKLDDDDSGKGIDMSQVYLWLFLIVLMVGGLTCLVVRSTKQHRVEQVAEFRRQVKQYAGRIWFNHNPNTRIATLTLKMFEGFLMDCKGGPKYCSVVMWATTSNGLGRLAQLVYGKLMAHDLWSSMSPADLKWAQDILFTRNVDLYVPNILENATLISDEILPERTEPLRASIEVQFDDALANELVYHLIRIVSAEEAAQASTAH